MSSVTSFPAYAINNLDDKPYLIVILLAMLLQSGYSSNLKASPSYCNAQY